MILSLLTPEKVLIKEVEIEWVSVPTRKGEQTIYAGHSPLLTALDVGILEYCDISGVQHQLNVCWGYCEVNGSTVSVLAEKAEEKSEIDLERAQSQMTEAEKMLEDAELTLDDIERVQQKMKKEQSRIDLASL